MNKVLIMNIVKKVIVIGCPVGLIGIISKLIKDKRKLKNDNVNLASMVAVLGIKSSVLEIENRDLRRELDTKNKKGSR